MRRIEVVTIVRVTDENDRLDGFKVGGEYILATNGVSEEQVNSRIQQVVSRIVGQSDPLITLELKSKYPTS
ncbi:hypothetical protein SEA_GREENHEARTS_59 [Arthrobacter phage GreenHearts]|uniref:Uncharacterized protein n=2 Tax=Korravirus TaxID=1982076 RepID=A0A3S9UCQ6_9CAUD|nr:hypothetical protein KDI97_gp59 [Arthrobacter phage GreenHearts]AZS08038.1 hypothetical protein SEA_GREENHEARTS_59 [Arthrobacter phage GreenHearts]WKW85615.1 hypothetical protein SEA_LAKSHMI_58 [Arthrobacter phage Lakshmi]